MEMLMAYVKEQLIVKSVQQYLLNRSHTVNCRLVQVLQFV